MVHKASGFSERARVQLEFLQLRGSGRDLRSVSCSRWWICRSLRRNLRVQMGHSIVREPQSDSWGVRPARRSAGERVDMSPCGLKVWQ
jgi:hypothetical protein